MSFDNNEYWTPPAENLFYRGDKSTVFAERLSESLETVNYFWDNQGSGKPNYGVKTELEDYMKSVDIDETYEFLIHPGYWLKEIGNPVEFYSGAINEEEFEKPHFNYEVYQKDLQNHFEDATSQNRPIFVLYSGEVPGRSFLEFTQDFVEAELDLSNRDYYLVPSVPFSGLIDNKKGIEDFNTILDYSTNIDFTVTGELNGLCPGQFEATLAAMTETSDDFNFEISRGPKFPRKPFKPGIQIADDSEIRTTAARSEFERFLNEEIKEL